MTLRNPTLTLLLGLGLAGTVCAQSYDDLTLVRNRPYRFPSVFQIRAGMLGGIPEDKDVAAGLDDDFALDGHIFWRAERIGERTDLVAYAGRDGAYVSLTDSEVVGSNTQTRLEFATEYFGFRREGFYRGDNFVPTGFYESDDYLIRLGFAKEAQEGITFEIAPFYRAYSFSRNDQTPGSYVVPEDYNAYGARITLEHNTLQLDNSYSRPVEGFIFTIAVEREQNDSDRLFGVPGTYLSELPSGVWRGEGHLEWYFPSTQTTFWELIVDGRLYDKEDRIAIYDAYSSPGHLTVDGQLRYRFDFGPATITPFAMIQFLKVLEENGVGSGEELFFGGGIEGTLDFGNNFSLVGEYSYLNNEYRRPIGIDEDLHGEHVFFAGVEVRFGN